MSFNTDTGSTKEKKLNFPYTLHHQVLERVDGATYLGVELSNDLTLARHINKTAMTANTACLSETSHFDTEPEAL